MKTDNELIAEFMGLNVSPVGCVTYDNGKKLLNSEDLQYDESWDWLMPVVKNIEDIEEPVSANPERGGCWPYQFEILSRSTVQIIDNRNDSALVTINYDHLTKIQSVYKAVVEFIKWYNSQEK